MGRVNSRLKEFAKLDNLKVRGLVKIRLHGLLAMLDSFQDRLIAYAETVNTKQDDTAKFFGLGRKLSDLSFTVSKAGPKLGKMTFHYIARGRTIGWLGE